MRIHLAILFPYFYLSIDTSFQEKFESTVWVCIPSALIRTLCPFNDFLRSILIMDFVNSAMNKGIISPHFHRIHLIFLPPTPKLNGIPICNSFYAILLRAAATALWTPKLLMSKIFACSFFSKRNIQNWGPTWIVNMSSLLKFAHKQEVVLLTSLLPRFFWGLSCYIRRCWPWTVNWL